MIINIEQLVKTFRTDEVETTAINHVDLTVEVGDFVSIMGPSGCGKSTFLNLLGLIDNPTDGRYEFMGTDVSKFSERQRVKPRKNNIGFIFQSFNLIDDLTVYENVELPLVYANVPLQTRREKVEFVLGKVNIAHRRNHFPLQLSGGQQQRVAVARAVVHSPTLILADEPTGNLDSEHSEEVMKMLWGLNEEGTTIVMVTHSEEDASVGKRIISMLDGKIVGERKNTARAVYA
jgi:putative ABC transport system ATP-binding protein